MPRPLKYPETVIVRLPAGTLDALARIVTDGETRADVIRAAIVALIEARG